MCVVRSRLIILCFVVGVAVFVKDRCFCPFGVSQHPGIVLDDETNGPQSCGTAVSYGLKNCWLDRGVACAGQDPPSTGADPVNKH